MICSNQLFKKSNNGFRFFNQMSITKISVLMNVTLREALKVNVFYGNQSLTPRPVRVKINNMNCIEIMVLPSLFYFEQAW